MNGAAPPSAARRRAPPLAVLGFDVADGALLRQLAARGELPTLAAVMERGCWGRIGGAELVSEHGVWVSLLSGVSRGVHGTYYFRQLEPGSYDLVLRAAPDARVAPFWAALVRSGRRIAVVDAPDFAALPGAPGVQVVNWCVHQPTMASLGAEVEPAELRERLGAICPPGSFVPEFDRTASEADDLRTLDALLERVARKGALCREVVRGGDFDLVCAVFSEGHPAGHRFWKYRGDPTAGGGRLCRGIREVVRAIDREMGRLLAELASDANVVVVASLGMVGRHPTWGFNGSLCRALGYQQPQPGRPSPLGAAAALARRLAPPAARRALAARVSDAARERRLAHQLRAGTDWSRTTAFTLPSLHTGFVRVNLRGREPAGIVEPGAGYAEVLRRLETDVAALIDPSTGRPAVKRFSRADRLFGGGPPRELPDAFLEWEPVPHFVERLEHPRATLTQERPAYCPDSYHTLEGFFAAAGPGVRPAGDVGAIDALDLAPTCLALADAEPPRALAGRALAALAPHRG